MRKIQILFPDPVLSRLRRVAKQEDRPVSELVRLAVDRFLGQIPETSTQRPSAHFPVFRGGAMKTAAEQMKEIIYEDDALQP